MARPIKAALVGLIIILSLSVAAAGTRPVVVELTTTMGKIDVAIAVYRAPITATNFLRYVDHGLYDGASFYRVVTRGNDHNPRSKVDLIQGGLRADEGPLGRVSHETTRQSGIRHEAGIISMGRDEPGSAGSEFFIALDREPSLDYGGSRKTDGQGFAAFGRVIRGMEVVRTIYRQPTDAPEQRPYFIGQMLSHPVLILTARRLGGVVP